MDFLMNIFSGGLLGAVTNLFGAWMKHKDQQEKNSHELKMVKATSEAALAEIQANVQVSKVVAEGNVLMEEARSDTAESIGRSGLIENLTGKYLKDGIVEKMIDDNSWTGKAFRPLLYGHLLLMDAVRGLVRPVLTVGVIGYISFVVNKTLTPFVLSGDAELLMRTVTQPSVQLLLFSASTMVGFWFADKSMAKDYRKSNK